jgi:hypothetical protein
MNQASENGAKDPLKKTDEAEVTTPRLDDWPREPKRKRARPNSQNSGDDADPKEKMKGEPSTPVDTHGKSATTAAGKPSSSGVHQPYVGDGLEHPGKQEFKIDDPECARAKDVVETKNEPVLKSVDKRKGKQESESHSNLKRKKIVQRPVSKFQAFLKWVMSPCMRAKHPQGLSLLSLSRVKAWINRVRSSAGVKWKTRQFELVRDLSSDIVTKRDQDGNLVAEDTKIQRYVSKKSVWISGAMVNLL